MCEGYNSSYGFLDTYYRHRTQKKRQNKWTVIINGNKLLWKTCFRRGSANHATVQYKTVVNYVEIRTAFEVGDTTWKTFCRYFCTRHVHTCIVNFAEITQRNTDGTKIHDALNCSRLFENLSIANEGVFVPNAMDIYHTKTPQGKNIWQENNYMSNW